MAQGTTRLAAVPSGSPKTRAVTDTYGTRRIAPGAVRGEHG
jgi:hypothetical protein